MTTISANLEIALYFGCFTTAHIFQKIAEDIQSARETARDFHDGKHWVRSPIDHLMGVFPWISERTFRNKIKDLVNDELLVTRVISDDRDRTRWFALVNEEKVLSELFES
jgi:hypothetical protein